MKLRLNIDSFYHMVDDEKIHCFSHDKDEVTLNIKRLFIVIIRYQND